MVEIRLTVGALVILIGALTAPTVRADCAAVEAYTYHQGDPGTRHYAPGTGPRECVPPGETGFPTVKYTRAEDEANDTTIPPGTPTGGGVAVWVVAP